MRFLGYSFHFLILKCLRESLCAFLVSGEWKFQLSIGFAWTINLLSLEQSALSWCTLAWWLLVSIASPTQFILEIYLLFVQKRNRYTCWTGTFLIFSLTLGTGVQLERTILLFSYWLHKRYFEIWSIFILFVLEQILEIGDTEVSYDNWPMKHESWSMHDPFLCCFILEAIGDMYWRKLWWLQLHTCVNHQPIYICLCSSRFVSKLRWLVLICFYIC